MSNRAWQKAFSLLYQPPAPQRKGAFLERLEPPGLSTGEFLLSQLFYLRPWNWLLAAAIFAAALSIVESGYPHNRSAACQLVLARRVDHFRTRFQAGKAVMVVMVVGDQAYIRP